MNTYCTSAHVPLNDSVERPLRLAVRCSLLLLLEDLVDFLLILDDVDALALVLARRLADPVLAVCVNTYCTARQVTSRHIVLSNK